MKNDILTMAKKSLTRNMDLYIDLYNSNKDKEAYIGVLQGIYYMANSLYNELLASGVKPDKEYQELLDELEQIIC